LFLTKSNEIESVNFTTGASKIETTLTGIDAIRIKISANSLAIYLGINSPKRSRSIVDINKIESSPKL